MTAETPPLRAPTVDTSQIKGAAFREFLRFYARVHGQATLQAKAAALPEDARALLAPDAPVLGVLASSWYPASAVHALLEQLTANMSDREQRELAESASQAVMDATLHGVYRVLFDWMATPERYARYAPKLWHTYYDSGVLTVQPQPSGLGALSTIRDWTAHHPFICELNRGASIAIYVAMGCKDVECDRLACVSRGATECRFMTRYRTTKS